MSSVRLSKAYGTSSKAYKLKINKKKVYRLCKLMDVLRPQPKIIIKYPKRLVNNRVITGSNQFWEVDIMGGFMVSSAFSFL